MHDLQGVIGRGIPSVYGVLNHTAESDHGARYYSSGKSLLIGEEERKN